MAVDKAYFEKLAQEAGLDDASRTVILKALENEKFAKPLIDGFVRQDDYSRSMDTLRSDREKLTAEEKGWREWYAGAVAREAEWKEYVAAYEAKYGKLDGTGGGSGGGGGTGGGTGLTAKQVEDMLAKERGGLVALTKAAVRIASSHAAKFHEELDVDAVEKIALEKGIKVEDAYQLFIQPRVQAAEKADWENKLKAAREEGAKEERSKHHIPDDAATSRGHHVLFDRPKADAVPDARTRAANFAEAWNTAATKPAA